MFRRGEGFASVKRAHNLIPSVCRGIGGFILGSEELSWQGVVKSMGFCTVFIPKVSRRTCSLSLVRELPVDLGPRISGRWVRELRGRLRLWELEGYR